MPDGRAVTFTYGAGPSVSLLSTIEDPGARIYSFTYDSHANLTQYTAPSGCATQFTVNGSGNVFSVEDSRGYITQYGYTANAQVATMVAGSAVWSWTYSTGSGSDFLAATMVDPAGGATEWYLNNNGFYNHIVYPTMVVSYVYNANNVPVQEIHPNGAVLSVVYNAAGQPLVSDDILGYRTTYQYSSAGDPTTILDACGFTWTNIFDVHHNLTAKVDPLGRRETFTYDAYGNVLTSQDGRGLVTSNSWDSHGNLVSSPGQIRSMKPPLTFTKRVCCRRQSPR